MKLKPEELTANGYVLLNALQHKELMPFVSQYIKKNNRFVWIFRLTNILAMGLIVFLILYDKAQGVDLKACFRHACYGFVLLLPLIPLHEFLHIIAYRNSGATHTSLDVNLKKFYFLAIADQFVSNKKEFSIVALAPFVIITAMLIIGVCVAPPLWAISCAAALMIHSFACIGDFAMLSYWQTHHPKEIVTYDDKGEGVSFFYEFVGREPLTDKQFNGAGTFR